MKAISSDFKIGDKAVSKQHGVAEVMAVESRDIAGQKKSFYILKVLETGMKLMVATDGADRSLRTVISKKDADRVIEILKSDEIAVAATQPWNRRQREYQELLRSGSPFQVAKVLRDLSRLKSDKDLSYGEKKLLDDARKLLVTELALARRIKEAKVEAEIQAIFSR